MIRSRGHCNTMGTASTMALVAEALGMVAARPRRHARRRQPAARRPRTTPAGLAVEMVAAQRRPSDMLTRGSFLNAIVALAAIGGSTNAVVHLLAIAGPAGHRAHAGRLRPHRIGRAAAGRPAAGRAVPDGGLLPGRGAARGAARGARTCSTRTPITVTGRPLVEYLDEAEIWDQEVIRARAEPLQPHAGIAVLYGNLAPDGAVIKPAAASPDLLQHRGRAVVFDSIEDMHARIDDPDLDVDADSVLVLRGCGPKGYPGMPEVGQPAAAGQAAAAGRARHGADLRRPDERHRLRHRGAARGARGGGRRPARPGPHRRHHRARRRRAAASTSTCRPTSWPPAPSRPGHSRPRSPRRPAAGSSCTCSTVQQADTGADLDFLLGSSGPTRSRANRTDLTLTARRWSGTLLIYGDR